MAVVTITGEGFQQYVPDPCDDCGCEGDEVCAKKEPVDLTKLKKAELIEVLNDAVVRIRDAEATSARREAFRVDAMQRVADLTAEKIQLEARVAHQDERIENLKAASYILAGEAVT